MTDNERDEKKEDVKERGNGREREREKEYFSKLIMRKVKEQITYCAKQNTYHRRIKGLPLVFTSIMNYYVY